MADKIITYVCSTCGSEDVSQDAWADWDPASEQMELRSSFDDSYCHTCETEVKTDEIEITDPDRIASIMAERKKLRAQNRADRLLDLVQKVEIDWGGLFDGDEPMNGGDCCEWICNFIQQVRPVLAEIEGEA